MLSGHCLCGTVHWESDGNPTPLSHCHCSMCRKAHGAPFVTFTSCSTDSFRWTRGEDAVRSYASSPGLVRRFCGICGSALPTEGPEDGEIDLPAGGIDPEPKLHGGRHIFTKDKLPWIHIPEDATAFDAYAPEDGLPTIDRPASETAKEGEALTGSCLCGAVAFEITEPFAGMVNCHCSRCRAARAAAHTTNGFVPRDGFRFTKGEDQIIDYKLPEAAAFGQAFCAACGSGVPRYSPVREMYAVPIGVLDRLPASGPTGHIFAASKAGWFEITDELPQYETYPT